MKKKYTRKQIVEAINYWKKQIRLGNYKRKLNESVDGAPTYTGKMVGYKWVYFLESNIEETQFLKTFDSEATAIQAGVDDIMKEVGSWDNNFCEPNDGKFFNSAREAADYFNKNKCVECTDGNSFKHVVNVKRIRASDMPKLLEIVYAAKDDTEWEIEFDGNNLNAMNMYGFYEWDKILDLLI